MPTMLQLFPLKGENIPDDALTSIQYQPAIKGEVTAPRRRSIASSPGITASILP